MKITKKSVEVVEKEIELSFYKFSNGGDFDIIAGPSFLPIFRRFVDNMYGTEVEKFDMSFGDMEVEKLSIKEIKKLKIRDMDSHKVKYFTVQQIIEEEQKARGDGENDYIFFISSSY